MTPVNADIQLRPISGDDYALIYSWRQQPSVRQFNPLDDISLEEMRDRYLKTSTDLTDKSHTNFRWMVEKNGAAVGSVALNNVNWRMGLGELGYGISEDHHGKGIGTKAVALLVAKVLKDSTLNRIIAYVSTENVASWKLLERLGFRREGTLRQHYVVQGRRVDEHIYGILRSDWETDLD